MGGARQRQHREGARRYDAAVARARKDLDRALARLRQLVPPGFPALDDDALFELRDVLLKPVAVPPPRPRRGRPWEWKHEADAALQQAGVARTDRRELMAVLGFIDDE